MSEPYILKIDQRKFFPSLPTGDYLWCNRDNLKVENQLTEDRQNFNMRMKRLKGGGGNGESNPVRKQTAGNVRDL